MIFIGSAQMVPSHPKAKDGLIAADKAITGAAVDDCGQPKVLLVDRMKQARPGSNLGRTERTDAHFSYVRCPVGHPCMTIQKSVSFGGITIWHPTEERNCSIGELKRIASYPDNYQLVGDYQNKVNRIGNSVPPLFMRAIARHIRQEMLADSATN